MATIIEGSLTVDENDITVGVMDGDNVWYFRFSFEDAIKMNEKYSPSLTPKEYSINMLVEDIVKAYQNNDEMFSIQTMVI